jgi:hypothetical protein
LVIGNAAYQHAHPLNNPANDANAMAETLRRLDFDIVSLVDADRTKMAKALGEFRRKLSADGVGLFYYAGHGVQVRGRNYLIPIEADIADENYAGLLAIDLESVQHVMEDAGVRLSLFILDACRDDDYARGEPFVPRSETHLPKSTRTIYQKRSFWTCPHAHAVFVGLNFARLRLRRLLPHRRRHPATLCRPKVSIRTPAPIHFRYRRAHRRTRSRWASAFLRDKPLGVHVRDATARTARARAWVPI